MPKPILSPPPFQIDDVSEHQWKKWFNELFDRIGQGPFTIQGFTVASLPSADGFAAITGDLFSSLVLVSDETGGATVAFSDGTNWRRVQDRAIVS